MSMLVNEILQGKLLFITDWGYVFLITIYLYMQVVWRKTIHIINCTTL